jgi:hypothetical protein
MLCGGDDEDEFWFQKVLPVVIVPDMIFGSLRMSMRQAIGMPQLATGPQKCVLLSTKINGNQNRRDNWQTRTLTS